MKALRCSLHGQTRRTAPAKKEAAAAAAVAREAVMERGVLVMAAAGKVETSAAVGRAAVVAAMAAWVEMRATSALCRAAEAGRRK